MNRYLALFEILRQAWFQIIIFTYILTMCVGIAKLASLVVRTYSCDFKDLTNIYLAPKNHEQVFGSFRDLTASMVPNNHFYLYFDHVCRDCQTGQPSSSDIFV